MSAFIRQETLEQFLEEAAIQIDHYMQAREHLSKIPNLTREVFSLALNTTTEDVLKEGLNKVIYRLNSSFFISKMQSDLVTYYCLNQYFKAVREQLDIEKAEHIVALLNNQVETKDIIAYCLENLKETKVKPTMRYSEKSDYSLGKCFAPDLVYPILLQKGETDRLAEIKQKILALKKGDQVCFEDLGFTFSIAQNGNLTIKIDKEVVQQLNDLLV